MAKGAYAEKIVKEIRRTRPAVGFRSKTLTPPGREFGFWLLFTV